MSYKGPHRLVLEHRQREDGRYTGGRLECGHEVVYERTQAKPAPRSICTQCKGMGPGHRWRGKGAATAPPPTPPAEPPPRPAPGGAPAEAGPPPPAPSSQARRFQEVLTAAARALDALGLAAQALEEEVLAARAVEPKVAPPPYPAPPPNFPCAVVPVVEASGWSTLEEARRQLAAVDPVRRAVVTLFRTSRSQALNPLEWEEALEAVERAARTAGWFDDAQAKDRATPVERAQGGRGPGAGGRGGGEAGGQHRAPGRAPPGAGPSEGGPRAARGRGPQKLTSPREA